MEMTTIPYMDEECGGVRGCVREAGNRRHEELCEGRLGAGGVRGCVREGWRYEGRLGRKKMRSEMR
jgi:hypothetical protein